MTRYLEILSSDRPANFNEDTGGRAMFSMNFRARAVAPVTAWELELIKILSDAGLATLGTDAFTGRSAEIPTGDGPYIQVFVTGGLETEETHDDQEYERPTAQVVVIARDYDVADARALAVWRAIRGTRGLTVVA